MHGAAGHQSDRVCFDCEAGAQAGSSVSCPAVGQTLGAGESHSPALHSQQEGLLAPLAGIWPAALQREQHEHR